MSFINTIREAAKTNDHVKVQDLETSDMTAPDFPAVSSIWKGVNEIYQNKPQRIGCLVSVTVVQGDTGKHAIGIITYTPDDVPPLAILASAKIAEDSTLHTLYLMLLSGLAEHFLLLASDIAEGRVRLV